jgi:hypothetical protein
VHAFVFPPLDVHVHVIVYCFPVVPQEVQVWLALAQVTFPHAYVPEVGEHAPVVHAPVV